MPAILREQSGVSSNTAYNTFLTDQARNFEGTYPFILGLHLACSWISYRARTYLASNSSYPPSFMHNVALLHTHKQDPRGYPFQHRAKRPANDPSNDAHAITPIREPFPHSTQETCTCSFIHFYSFLYTNPLLSFLNPQLLTLSFSTPLLLLPLHKLQCLILSHNHNATTLVP